MVGAGLAPALVVANGTCIALVNAEYNNYEPSPKSTISVSKQAAKRVIIRLKCIRARRREEL